MSSRPSPPPAPLSARVAAALAAAALTAGCVTASPDVVARHDAQRWSTVADATVLAVRPVVVDGSQSGIGATAGGVAGAIAGSSVGGWRERGVASVLGAVVGGIVGNAVERGATRESAVEILVQMSNGERRAVVQALGQERFQPGDPVIVVTSGGRARVSMHPAAAAAPRPAPIQGGMPG